MTTARVMYALSEIIRGEFRLSVMDKVNRLSDKCLSGLLPLGKDLFRSGFCLERRTRHLRCLMDLSTVWQQWLWHHYSAIGEFKIVISNLKYLNVLFIFLVCSSTTTKDDVFFFVFASIFSCETGHLQASSAMCIDTIAYSPIVHVHVLILMEISCCNWYILCV